MIAIIGSHAINYHVAGFRRTPADTDLVMSYDRFIDWLLANDSYTSLTPLKGASKFVVVLPGQGIHEIEIAQPGSSAALLLDLLGSQGCGSVGGYVVPPLNLLYAVKLSHRYLKNSPHFAKTMLDIDYLRGLGCRVDHPEFLKQREAETYTYGHPKLNQDKQGFFSGDGVLYRYDHDSLHWAVKLGDRPAYQYFKPEDREVMVSRKLWAAASPGVRLNSVVEEACVLALERSQIPFEGQVAPITSFMTAMMKVCTSITSGWWREFAYDHYYQAVAAYPADYVDRFHAALAQGVVKPYTGGY